MTNSEYHRTYYHDNKTRRRAQLKEYRQRAIESRRKFVWSYLLQNPCVDCGNTDPRVLEFDHIGVKAMDISRAIRNCWSEENLLKEITQCEVVCANCHRIRTADRAETWRSKM